MRTKESKYYTGPGATEQSAMSSAEGKVQHLNYKATFPLLLNIAGEPTYFISLKDYAGLVKLYAMVNVSQYQLVATGENIQQCEREYIELLKQGNGDEQTGDAQTAEGIITDIRTAVIDGNSCYFISIDTSDKVFIIQARDFKEVVVYNIGDKVKIVYVPDDELIEAISIQRTAKAG